MRQAGQPHDPVNHPGHYTFGRFEVIDVLEDWFPADPLLWQVGKYIARAGRKGSLLEDLKKAAWYLNRRIEKETAAGSFPALIKKGRKRYEMGYPLFLLRGAK
jgi:hypothetical protein